MAIGGIISTGSHPKALWPGVHAFWGQKYDEHAKEYLDLYDQLDSSMADEQYGAITGFGLAPAKAEGAPMTYDYETQGVISTYTHIAYALGYIVTYEELQDNLSAKEPRHRVYENAYSITQKVKNIGAGENNENYNDAVSLNDNGPP